MGDGGRVILSKFASTSCRLAAIPPSWLRLVGKAANNRRRDRAGMLNDWSHLNRLTISLWRNNCYRVNGQESVKVVIFGEALREMEALR